MEELREIPNSDRELSQILERKSSLAEELLQFLEEKCFTSPQDVEVFQISTEEVFKIPDRKCFEGFPV
jgi:hypothetical protein